MALNTAQSEVDFTRSSKKHILDGVPVYLQNAVFFDYQYETPVDGSGLKLEKWIVVEYADRELIGLGNVMLIFNLFTRKDPEYSEMYSLSDDVVKLFLSENSPINIQLYNTSEDPWELYSGVHTQQKTMSEIYIGKDKTSIRLISYLCKWGI